MCVCDPDARPEHRARTVTNVGDSESDQNRDAEPRPIRTRRRLLFSGGAGRGRGVCGGAAPSAAAVTDKDGRMGWASYWVRGRGGEDTCAAMAECMTCRSRWLSGQAAVERHVECVHVR